MKQVKIAELEVYHPAQVIDNAAIERRINARSDVLPPGSIQRLFGIRERRFAQPHEQVSDLAASAGQPIVDRVGAQNIDFLIFASACADLIEPATCNIVQQKLGLRCPAMDVKNACNSFVSGLMTASALIQSGQCRSVLVVNGEKLSDSIRFELANPDQMKRHLPAYSFGDAGAAALVTVSGDASGFYLQRFMTRGEHWALCTVSGGGSLYPHDVEKNYFEGQTVALKSVILKELSAFFEQCLQEAGWQRADIRHLFTHQVSDDSFRTVTRALDLDNLHYEPVFQFFGNTAGASIPLAIHQSLRNGRLKKGDKVALLGLASGVSISLQLLTW